MRTRRGSPLVPMLVTMVLLATTATAGLDPDPDSLGLYFEPNGNVNCAAVPAFTPTPCYLILENPTATIEGFACSLDLVGGPYFILAQDLSYGAVDEDATAGGIRVTGVAYPYSADLIVLGTWNVMLQAPSMLVFYLRPHPDPSLPRGLPAIRRGGQWLRCGIASGNVDLPVANLNGPCPVAAATTSFGAVKSLYR